MEQSATDPIDSAGLTVPDRRHSLVDGYRAMRCMACGAEMRLSRRITLFGGHPVPFRGFRQILIDAAPARIRLLYIGGLA